MAGLHEPREDSLMQSDDSTCSASTDRTPDVIFVGIDLGTCYSGISYGRFYLQDLAFPRCWIHTATLGDISGSRVQTRIPVNYYDKHFKGPFLEWFKMSLFRNENLPDDVLRSSMFTELTILRKRLKVSAVTAMADYLKLLWSDFHGSLDYSIYDFEYNLIITVPGNWPVYVRQMMLEAIHKANILSDKVHLIPKFISDVEAASIALVLDLIKEHNGTESTAYKICPRQPLQMEEITRGECIFAGGALIDNAFMNILKAKIKKKHPRSIIDNSEEQLREIAHDYWEKDMKCNFSGDRRERTFEVPYGVGERSSAIDHHRVSLPPEAVSTIIANSSVNNTVWLYCKPGNNLHEKPFCTITWSRVGPKTEFELGFEWDNFHMEVSILREGRKVDGLSIEYHPHA
ncbi:hypothetical protein HYE67_005463 [Fusarium culmorum]|uniref:Heat shock 70 kDa protein 12A n=1 Tax=Fusarium culmorum TaxID=5516 RepID=A0A7S8D731_FUSCU|nr:hypothetical protein HYE67_005463 [Fusarium culmorum]